MAARPWPASRSARPVVLPISASGAARPRTGPRTAYQPSCRVPASSQGACAAGRPPVPARRAGNSVQTPFGLLRAQGAPKSNRGIPQPRDAPVLLPRAPCYLSLNVMGSEKCTFTGLPRCLPGLNFAVRTTRSASWSQPAPMPRVTVAFVTLPCSSTTKEI